MKHKRLLIASTAAIPLLLLLTSSTLDSNGKLAAAGGPGEGTCSQSGCHGAGNGSSSSGGLADNAGPGSISLATNPAFVSNQYTPGATYHMTVTVSETGKSLFGFDFEALDNSGSTNLMTNNATGTITVTDAVHTRVGQYFGTGRLTCTHKPGGGAFSNAAAFVFDWTAPASGTVNFYYDGIAANNDGLSNAPDNVYAHSLQVTPALASGIQSLEKATGFAVYPNPCNDVFHVAFEHVTPGTVQVDVLSIDGSLVKTYDEAYNSGEAFSQRYSTQGLAPGIYMVRIIAGTYHATKKLSVN